MKRFLRTPLGVSVIALVVSVVSQVFVEMAVAGGSTWDDFDKAIWVTVLITVPAFSIAIAAALYAAYLKIRIFKKYQTPRKGAKK